MILLRPQSDRDVPLLHILQWLPQTQSFYFDPKGLLDLLSVRPPQSLGLTLLPLR